MVVSLENMCLTCLANGWSAATSRKGAHCRATTVSRHCRSSAVIKPDSELSRMDSPRNTACPSTLAISFTLDFGGHTRTPDGGKLLLTALPNA